MASNFARIPEQTFQRFLGDLEARHEIGAEHQKRNVEIQRLLAKLHCLSDGEFEDAFRAVEAMVDGYVHRKILPEKKRLGSSEQALSEVNSIIQNPKKSA
jgi:hypothetical protein